MLNKWLGGGLILIATTYIGFQKVAALSGRVRSLGALQTGLSILESEISFSANHLKQAFAEIERAVNVDGLFLMAGDKIAELGAAEAWEKAVKEKKDRLFLTDTDAQALTSLAAELGVTDRENQIKNIRRVNALLLSLAQAAQAEYEKSARLCRSGGILVGMLVVILLL